ncbi:hypothetical protein HI914_05933 [Erysiphe necator]|nr:hypothetical protein HI914_05933 [Erysiphe necator]
MSLSPDTLEGKIIRQKRDELSSKILVPTFQVGVLSGLSGLFIGAIAGTLRCANPILFSLASGIQCSILGSSITAFRKAIIHSRGNDELSPNEKLSISSISGALGGGTSGAILRGRKNVIPGAVMFAILMTTGQFLFNKLEQRDLRHIPRDSDNFYSWMRSKWLPLRFMSDEEYETILKKQLCVIKAEIALIDKKIQAIQNN